MRQVYRNENGSTMLMVTVVLILITLIGMMAVQTSTFEVRIADNDARYRQGFYRAEAGLSNAIVIFDRIYHNAPDGSGNLLYLQDAANPPLKHRNPVSAAVSFPSPLLDNNNIPVAWIEVRCVTLASYTTGLSRHADEVPSQKHIGPAPMGYDRTLYRSRRYMITSTELDPRRYDPNNPDVARTARSISGGVTVAVELSKVEHLLHL